MSPMTYIVVLYNSSGERIAAFENAGTPTYSRSKNAADQVTISIPRNDDKRTLIKIGQRFEILRALDDGTTTLEMGGYVSYHGYSDEVYEISGFTEEIVLTWNFTPPQFGYPLYSENQNLGALADQLKKTYIIERVKHNWGDYVQDSNNVDWTTNPTFVILQDQDAGSGVSYPSSGYIVFRFQKLASQEWERFRWVSDYYTDEDGEVKTEVSYRQSDDPNSWPSFTTPQGGALTDVVGIILADPNKEYTEIRVDFSTDTTEASPVLFALEVIKRGSDGVVDTVEYPAGASSITTPGLSADSVDFLSVLSDACEESGWEFRVVDNKLELAETFGTDRTNEYSVVSA